METKNWQKKDFIKSFADEGKEEYLKFAEFQKRYSDFPSSVCEFCFDYQCVMITQIRGAKIHLNLFKEACLL